MSSALAPVLAALAALVALSSMRLAERLAPGWLVPAHRVLLAPAGLATALALVALSQSGALETLLSALDPADTIGHRGLARRGADGALTLLLIGLASLFIVYLVARALFAFTRPRDPDRPPVPRWMAVFGLSPDGTPSPAQLPLRLGAWVVLPLALVSMAWLPSDTTTPSSATSLWAAALTFLISLIGALDPSRSKPAEALTADTLAPPIDDEVARWLAEAGPSTPLPGEPAVSPAPDPDGLWPDQRRILSMLDASAIVLAGPGGTGKRTAALILALHRHERTGRRILWLGETDPSALRERLVAIQKGPSLAAVMPLEVRSAENPELASAAHSSTDEAPSLIVVELGETITGVQLARLRYAIHRLGATSMSNVRPPVVVLGPLSPGAMSSAARAIAAREPVIIQPRPHELTPTAAIDRALLTSAAPMRPPPPGAALLTLGRPRAMPRYPHRPITRIGRIGPITRIDRKGPIHELVAVPGGPRGRRVLDWLGRGTPTPPERRLLLNLPGDREVPERRLQLARTHLRLALSEAFHERTRLEVVFSHRLVEAELAALSGRLTERKTADGQTWLHLDDTGSTPTTSDSITLREPRGGTTLEVPRESVDLLAYEGALLSGHEVAFGVDGERLLVPTTATATTPIRRLRFAATSTRESVSLHRFQGEAALELRVTRLVLSGTHLGVRRFEAREERSHTTLLGEAARLIPPRPVEAVFVPLPDASAVALHTLRHVIAEALPLVFENADDVCVSYTLEDELSRPGLVFWDRHQDGLGAVHDLRGPDLLALLTECRALLTCTCLRHCASCCESVTCTTPEVELDRHAALSVLEPIFAQRSLRSVG